MAACLLVHYARVTARHSIGHVKKSLFRNTGSDVQGGSVGRASVFHSKDLEDEGSSLTLVTFFFFFFLLSDS